MSMNGRFRYDRALRRRAGRDRRRPGALGRRL